MQFEETGNSRGKTLMLLPGTGCDYQTNFGSVLDRLAEKYHLICVNYDGFDGSDLIFLFILFPNNIYLDPQVSPLLYSFIS